MGGVVLVWGINLSVMKLAVGEVAPAVFNALRFPLGAAVLGFLVFRLEPHPWPHPEEWPDLVRLGLLAHPIYQLCFLNGLALTSASHAAVLVTTTPVFIALADHFVLRERLGMAARAGIALSFAGVLVLTLAQGGGSGGSLLGDFLVLASGVLWTAYSIRARILLRARSPLWLTAWALLVGTPFVVALGVPGLLRLDWSTPTAITWGGAVYAGLLALAAAYSWWAVGIRALGASRAAVFSNLIPVVGLTVAYLWLGETLPPLAWLGAAIAIAGVWLTTTRHLREAPERAGER
jgi:drug/metabolite transporter (DMT)-like permease